MREFDRKLLFALILGVALGAAALAVPVTLPIATPDPEPYRFDCGSAWSAATRSPADPGREVSPHFEVSQARFKCGQLATPWAMLGMTVIAVTLVGALVVLQRRRSMERVFADA